MSIFYSSITCVKKTDVKLFSDPDILLMIE